MMQNPLNKTIMREVGLTTNKQNIVIDENREPIIVKDNYLKYSSQCSVSVKSNEQPFDPISNRYQMNVVFDHFLGKLEEDDIVVDMYREVHNGSAIEVVLNGGQTIVTKDYNDDSLKYVDAIMQLNGSTDEIDSLKKYDKKSKTKKKSKPKIDFNK